MREDQVKRLQDLSEQLADRFIYEADPADWPGDGRPPSEWTTEERGNAYWSKKNAMATGGVLRYTLDLLDKHNGGEPDDAAKDADMDRRVRDAEQRAAAATKRALDGARKKAFDARVIGKG